MSEYVAYSKAKNAEDAYKIVKTSITPATIEKFNVKANFDYYDDSLTMVAKGNGFDLRMIFEDKEVTVDLDLSFMLKPFKGKVMEGIKKMLGRVV